MTGGKRKPAGTRAAGAKAKSSTPATSATKVRHPKRVQARRPGVRNYRLVTRATRWGNPFAVPPHTRKESMAKYEGYLRGRLAKEPEFLEPLRGFNLGCTCAPGLACHVDVILRLLYRV